MYGANNSGFYDVEMTRVSDQLVICDKERNVGQILHSYVDSWVCGGAFIMITNTGEADLAWLGMKEMIMSLVLSILRLSYVWDIVKLSLDSRVQKSSFGKCTGLANPAN